MKIVTWNVNGIRSFDGKWKEILENLKADIICVQETKVTRKFRFYIKRTFKFNFGIYEFQEICWMSLQL